MTYDEKGDILASPEVPIETKYRFILSTHDWYYDYSDDNNVWNRGYAERKTLNRLQEKHDPDCKIWNEYAPEMYKR